MKRDNAVGRLARYVAFAIVLAGGLSGAAARGDLGTAGAPGVGVVRGLAVANAAHVEVMDGTVSVRPARVFREQRGAPCRPRHSNKCRPECADKYAGVAEVACRVRRTLNANGGGRYWSTWECIAWRESRFVENAVSPTHDYGVFQLHVTNLYLVPGGRWWVAEDNTLGALALWRLAGYSWSPWAVRGSCGA